MEDRKEEDEDFDEESSGGESGIIGCKGCGRMRVAAMFSEWTQGSRLACGCDGCCRLRAFATVVCVVDGVSGGDGGSRCLCRGGER